MPIVPSKKLLTFVVGGLLLVGVAAAQINSNSPPTLKQIADYALAETGAPIRPAWSAADEAISLSAQSASLRVISANQNRDREGALALRRACGVLSNSREIALKRSLHRADYASQLRIDLKPNLNSPDDNAIQRTNLVGLNRLDAYASGYEAGAFELSQFIFGLEPDVKVTICKIVAGATK